MSEFNAGKIPVDKPVIDQPECVAAETTPTTIFKGERRNIKVYSLIDPLTGKFGSQDTDWS
jgi:hypothetical protein